MQDDLRHAIYRLQGAFDLDLEKDVVERLAIFHALVREHNPLLHLVGPCSADEFAVRHLLESLFLLRHLPQAAKFVDIGTGAGLPSIPCLVAREDLTGTLIESKIKKAKFLDKAVQVLGLSQRATIVNRQFEETGAGEADFVTCRALDRFSEKLPRMIKWAGPRRMLFFGGPSLIAKLEKLRVEIKTEIIPMSQQRYLVDIQNGASGPS
jgi:16S rRNA (guanine527-N7)-methyltransferase